MLRQCCRPTSSSRAACDFRSFHGLHWRSHSLQLHKAQKLFHVLSDSNKPTARPNLKSFTIIFPLLNQTSLCKYEFTRPLPLQCFNHQKAFEKAPMIPLSVREKRPQLIFLFNSFVIAAFLGFPSSGSEKAAILLHGNCSSFGFGSNLFWHEFFKDHAKHVRCLREYWSQIWSFGMQSFLEQTKIVTLMVNLVIPCS